MSSAVNTPNRHDSDVYPLRWVLYGDKRKPFHIVHCLSPTGCKAELRFSPGKGGRLRPECIAKFATRQDWLCDRSGYALCPLHKPQRRSTLPPRQKVAAFLRIRDRDIAKAHSAMQQGDLPLDPKVVPIRPEARRKRRGLHRLTLARHIVELLDRDPQREWFPKNVRKALDLTDPKERFGVPHELKTLADEGKIVRVRRGLYRANPKTEEVGMSPSSAIVEAPAPVEPEAKLRENRNRVLDCLETCYNRSTGRYREDWSDAAVSQKLGLGLHLVAEVRAQFFGEDINEAALVQTEKLTEALAEVVKLKDEHLALAARSEEVERTLRKQLGIDRP